jgi:hypothetical protein
MNAETRAAIGRIIDRAADYAARRDAYAAHDQPDAANSLDTVAITYGHAAAYALDTDLCDVSTALAPDWAGNDIRTDAAGYAARLWTALGEEPTP